MASRDANRHRVKSNIEILSFRRTEINPHARVRQFRLLNRLADDYSLAFIRFQVAIRKSLSTSTALSTFSGEAAHSEAVGETPCS
jgi:hypothetical protein